MRAATMFSGLLVSSGLLFGLMSGAVAATCRDPAGFDAWLGKIKQEALAQGISARAVDEGLDGLTFDQNVYRHDHGQGVFRQSFEQFSQRMVPPRLARAKSLEKRYAPIFASIEQRYGVSSPVLLAIWGLETDFGAVGGNFQTIRAIATLAFDCRRSDMFKAELFDALRMVQRGAITPESHGAWAGEIGQTQFMPSNFHEICRELRRWRQPRPQSQCGRRARLDRTFPAAARLAARCRLGARPAELRGDPGVEQIVRLFAHDRLFRHPGSPAPTRALTREAMKRPRRAAARPATMTSISIRAVAGRLGRMCSTSSERDRPRVKFSVWKRAKGIEPSYEAWEASVLPLNYARATRTIGRGRRAIKRENGRGSSNGLTRPDASRP